MTGQPALPGKHDLPPRWNGRVVEWQEWEMPMPTFVCPPPRAECCPKCGSQSEQATSRGYVGVSAKVTLDQIDGMRRAGVVGRAALLDLIVHRCPDCRHDTVQELSSGEMWDLDLSDYEDGGSDHPAGIVWGYLR